MGATYSQKRTITNNVGIGTWCWLLSSLSVLTYGVPTTKSLLPLVSKPSIHVQRVKRPALPNEVRYLFFCILAWYLCTYLVLGATHLVYPVSLELPQVSWKRIKWL